MEKKESKYCDCLYFAANALSRTLTKMAEEEFAITGLAPSHAFLLMAVDEKPGIQPKELSMHLQLTPSTVTRLIEKLEYKGIVERKSSGRCTEVYPTHKCHELEEKVKLAWKNLHNRYVELLGEEKVRELTSNIYATFHKLRE
jgi:DNA-binding MarR family transcriptional regulator